MSTNEDNDGGKQDHKAENLKKFMHDVGMHPEDPDRSTMVVHEEGEDRVLTASIQEGTGKTIMHNTPIAHDKGKAPVQFGQPSQPAARPFLKAGKHGRGGDFDNDPDRRTGRGHQFTDEDTKGLDAYYSCRGQIFQRFPNYPRVGAGVEIPAEVREAWNVNEEWYRSYKEKYGGYAVSHLWPCGCERMRGASEEEESEEE
jgi:hypothetical protein